MSRNYDRELQRAVSLSGEDMTDEQYFLVQEAMFQVFDPEMDLTPEEERERNVEEYHAFQVQPHPEDVWNPRYRAMAKRLWPVFSRQGR